MHLSTRSWIALGFAGLLVSIGADARADGPPVRLSISLERAAGVSYASLRPTNSDTALHGTMFGIAGPAINPLALPRAAADAILPVGLTFGGAVGYGNVSLSLAPDHGTSNSLSGNASLLSPRIGYLVHLGSMFDLWPRAGVTLVGANLQEPDVQSCFSSSTNGVVVSRCSTSAGGADSVFFAAASVEVAAALRLTSSFNVLGGLAYDHVFAASGSSAGGSSSASSDLHVEGSYVGAQLWFGLGGYVL